MNHLSAVRIYTENHFHFPHNTTHLENRSILYAGGLFVRVRCGFWPAITAIQRSEASVPFWEWLSLIGLPLSVKQLLSHHQLPLVWFGLVFVFIYSPHPYLPSINNTHASIYTRNMFNFKTSNTANTHLYPLLCLHNPLTVPVTATLFLLSSINYYPDFFDINNFFAFLYTFTKYVSLSFKETFLFYTVLMEIKCNA